jgi:uncharacterized protein (TIGR03437 family)
MSDFATDARGTTLVVLAVEPVSSSLIPGGIDRPFVAADGAVYGWMVMPGRGIFPPVRIHPNAEVRGITLPADFPREEFQVSANGLYASGATRGVLADGSDARAEWMHLPSATRSVLPKDARFPSIASDSTVAYLQPGVITFGVFRTGPLRIPVQGTVQGMQIADDGRSLAALIDGSIRMYFRGGVASPETVQPATGSLTWSLSNLHLTYIEPTRRRIFVWDAHRQFAPVLLAESAEDFTSVVSSADGTVVWAATATGRLHRFDLRAGLTQEILPPLGHTQSGRPASAEGVAVPGSAMLLRGTFTRDQQVYVAGERWPLSDVNPQGYWFQVPWEWPGAEKTLLLRTDGNPFEDVVAISYGGVTQPYFPVASGTTHRVIAAHQDFRGIVSALDPARPGETIHVYMTGLGALERNVPTGVRGPIENPVKVARSISCSAVYFAPLYSEPLPTPVAVYAGGMLGINQVDVTLPADVPHGELLLNCDRASGLINTKP